MKRQVAVKADEDESGEEEQEDQEELMAKKRDFYKQVDNEEFF